MPLPACATVPANDVASIDALAAAGWRRIGTRVVFAGPLAPSGTKSIETWPGQDANHAAMLAQMINWSGRLWRGGDPSDTNEIVAHQAVRSHINMAVANDALICAEHGFVIFHALRYVATIQLIG